MEQGKHNTPLKFHTSLFPIVDTYRCSMVSLSWLNLSLDSAIEKLAPWQYVINLDCSVKGKAIKIDKTILQRVGNKSGENPTVEAIKGLCVLTAITAKETIWEENAFENLHGEEILQFLRHIRNGCAHHNKFYFGKGTERERVVKNFPVRWREKTLDESLEGKSVFYEFLAPGDILLLLSDITNLAEERLEQKKQNR